MNRTVIILNCKPEKLSPIKITLNPSRKKTLDVEKPALSSCIEGVSEYCRVSFDLLDKKAQTSVFLVQSTVNRLNNWTPKEQTTDKILNNTKIQSTVDKYETFKAGIKEAIRSIYEKPPKTKVVNTARIICIYQSQDIEGVYIDSDGAELNFVEFVQASLIEAQTEIQNKRTLSKVELLLMKVVDAQGKESVSEQKRIDDRLILETSTVRTDLLPEVFWDLAVSHYNLKGIKILGIPFKEKEETNSDKPADFNVILLMKSNEEPSALPMHIGKQLGHNIWHQSKLLPVYWSSSRPALKLECLPSKFVARITPCYSTSAPVVGLIRHIIAHGKPVLLSLNEDTDNLSHFLVQHGEGGPIYLHQIDDTAASLFDAPEAVEYYKSTIENVRMKDLTDLARQNILTAVAKEAHWTSESVNGTSVTTNKNIEYSTRFFPLSDRDTILFASKQSETLRAHLQPLKTYLLKESLSNEDIATALDIVDKFTALMQSNEVKMFPSTKGVAPKRRELFAELWKELKQLATLCKDQSSNHALILKQLENFENPGGVQPNVESTPTKGTAKRVRSNSNLSVIPMIVEEDKPNTSQGPKSDPIQPGSLDVFSSEKKVREDLRFKEERYGNKRKWTIDEPVTNPLDNCDKETLFYKYWNAQSNKKRAVELEGRKVAVPLNEAHSWFKPFWNPIQGTPNEVIMEEWISEALLSDDFELICSEIIKFNYSCSKTQKLSLAYLNRSNLSPEATVALVYCALVLKGNEVVTINTIPSTFTAYSAEDWLKCLEEFKSRTKNKHATRDCVHSLFKIGRLTFQDLIRSPMMLAALAHRISYQRLTEPMADGKSVVYHVLERHSGPLRYNFLQSLHSAYKDDFKHVITLDELLSMVQKKLKKCLTFLQSTKLRFPAINLTLCHVNPSLMQILDDVFQCDVEQAKPSGRNDLAKGVYEESTRCLFWVGGREERQLSILAEMAPFLKILYDVYYRPREGSSDGVVFPFTDLPPEITGLVAQFLDSRTAQALKCASKTISFNAKQLMQYQFPRRFHVLENGSKSGAVMWDSVYWRDASILQRWNTGKYHQFSLTGWFRCMDENLIIASTSPEIGLERHFVMNWSDGNKVWLSTTVTPTKACIIDSNDAVNPISALVSGDSIEIYRGPNRISTFDLPGAYFRTFISYNKKIYIDHNVYNLDDRWSCSQTYDKGKQLLDVNPINDMYMASYPEYMSMAPHYKIELYSNKQELIGHLMNSTSVRYYKAKFLDEHQFVCVSSNSIDFADTRKLDKLTASIPFTLNAYTIDPLNRRILNCSRESGLVTIFDLTTRQWTGGFYPQGIDSERCYFNNDVMYANSRFLVRPGRFSTISIFDFQI